MISSINNTSTDQWVTGDAMFLLLETLVLSQQRADIGQGVVSQSQDPPLRGPGGKIERRIVRWCSPLPVPLRTIARLNFLYS
jgi:hypothetical protein